MSSSPITMKSTIVSALITLDTEKQMDERFWNHLRVQRNILDFLYVRGRQPGQDR